MLQILSHTTDSNNELLFTLRLKGVQNGEPFTLYEATICDLGYERVVEEYRRRHGLVEMEPEVEPEVEREVAPEGEAEVKPEGEGEAKHELNPEMEPEEEAEVKPEVEHEMKPEVEAEGKPEMEP